MRLIAFNNINIFSLTLLILQIYACYAGVVINEVNVDDPAKPERKEFIELIAFGKKRPADRDTLQLEEFSLRGFKLIAISAYQQGSKGPTVELVANLWNSRISNAYFVFGGLGVENADLTVDSPLVTYRRKFTRTPTLFGFFGNANVYPHAIALLYQSDGLPALKLTEQQPFLKLTPQLKTLIKESLVDIVVYGRRASSEQCDIFEELHPDLTGKQYLLREFDIPKDSTSDYSLNRCTAGTTPIMPDKFKLGKPSPGSQNDCSGVRFIIETNIMEVTSPLTRHYRAFEDEEETGISEAQCSSRLAPDEYWSVRSNLVHKTIQTNIDMSKMNAICSSSDLGGDDITQTGNNAPIIQSADRAIGSMTHSTVEREWQTTSFFQDSWLKCMERHQKNLLPIKTVIASKIWFEYLPNEQDPAASKYRCRLCSKYYTKFGLDKRYKPVLAEEAGVLRPDYQSNWQTITDHAKHKQHLNIIAKLENAAKDSLPEKFKTIQAENEQEDNKYYAVTMRMIRTVYAEMKVNLPFMSHPKIVMLQEMNGVYMGYHHYDRMSASRMVTLISNEMHKSLIQHLTSKHQPISIILDGSTDSSQTHYLIVYFQALEDDIPIVYFYKLIELSADESAPALLAKLQEEWDKESNAFTQHLKKNLIGYGSDGAAVMMGKKGGLAKLLSDWLNRNLFSVHCMAHRLHLAIRNALEDVSYYKDFEITINEVHNFYNRHGHKRKAHLRALSEALNLKVYEVSYIFEARWISSEFQALKVLNDSWYLLSTDLDAISVDNSFSAETRNQATGLSKKIKNKNFLLILQFTCDVLQVLSHWSKRLQQRSGLLIGANEFKIQMLNTFEQLKTHQGSFTTFYLGSVACSDATSRPCSISNYYSSISVRWQTVELGQEGRVPRLDSFRVKFLVDIISEINNYFPSGNIEMFDVLAPKNLPQTEAEILLFGQDKINAMAQRFSLDPTATVSEWTQLMLKIIKEEDFCRFQKADAIAFWQHFLKSSNVVWGNSIKKLVHTVLVLPIGSADAERGFSIMNHIRSSRRSSLEGLSLDALLRIRINGPNDLAKFKAGKYAKAWVMQHHLRTDDPTQQKRKTRIETLMDDNVENIDFVYLPSSSIF